MENYINVYVRPKSNLWHKEMFRNISQERKNYILAKKTYHAKGEQLRPKWNRLSYFILFYRILKDQRLLRFSSSAKASIFPLKPASAFFYYYLPVPFDLKHELSFRYLFKYYALIYQLSRSTPTLFPYQVSGGQCLPASDGLWVCPYLLSHDQLWHERM